MAVHKRRFAPKDIAIFREAALQPGAMTAMLNYYRAMMQLNSAKEYRKKTPVKISLPTLMIWGEQDTALSKETTYGTDKWVSNLTLRYLPNASHWVQQDQPHIVNKMLCSWLQEQPVPEAIEIESELGE
jgi:pimeloyl-ACP methyl ester carboxylesterase